MSKPLSQCDRAGAPRWRAKVGRGAVLALLAGTALVPLSGLTTPTDLSNIPLPTYSSADSATILPNIMMVLDDSGSMDWDYLPDWANDLPNNYTAPSTSGTNAVTGAEGTSGTHQTNLPQYLYYNASFNGVAYNPAVTYSAPLNFGSNGLPDSTTYPAMSATNTKASSTSGAWTAVPNDGYGVQDSGNSSLVDNRNAYFFTTVPGEYCDSPALTNCQAATAPAGKFAYPAPLRWCSDQQLTTCRGLQSSTYKYPRMAAPRIAQLTINSTGSAGTIRGITVDGQQIMSAASATSSSTATVANNVAAQINACRYALPATTNCTIVGYVALSAATSNVVTIYAPGVTSATPVVTVGTGTSGNVGYTMGTFARASIPLPDYFAGGTRVRSNAAVPGENLRTVLTSSVNSYPYPGTNAKAGTRTDCAGTTCTFAEEMANYANWWAYYRTRMQMMKTATSRAFGQLDTAENIAAGKTLYRVGYLTINNNTTRDFVNVKDFDGAQKFTWFSKLFSANPGNNTPLRSALSTAGQLYGGTMNGNTFRGSTVTDPLQYSCQRNYTILSTDGYWNTNTSAPNGGVGSKLDGSTAVGNQDGVLPKPYSDGANQQTQTRTAQLQMRTNTLSAQKRTLQKQTSQQQQQTSTLQTQTSQLQKQVTQLQKRTSTLQGQTSQLQAATSTNHTSWSGWSNVTSCTWKTSGSGTWTKCQYLSYTSYSNVSSCTFSAQGTVTTDGTKWTGPATNCQYTGWTSFAGAASCTAAAQSTSPNYTVGTAVQCQSPVTSAYAGAASCTQTTTPDTNGFTTQCRTVVTSAYANAASCTQTTTPDTNGFTTQCNYTPWTTATNVASCTAVPQSASPNYTVGTAVACPITVTSAFANTTACTDTTGSPNASGQTTQCQYGAPATAATVLSCSPAYSATSTDYSNPFVYDNCTKVPGNWVNASTCTENNTPDAAGKTYDCTYAAFTSYTNVTTCTPVAKSTGPNYTVAVARECAISASGGTSDTLADVAAYYYNTDLRNSSQTAPDGTGTCSGPIIPPSTTVRTDLCTDNVPAAGRDVTPKQHMTTHTLGLGATGMMLFSPYQNDGSGNRTYVQDYWSQPSGDFFDVANGSVAAPTSGICPWQTAGTICTWPTPSSDSPANIDDLWHAAVNGHGTYFSAGDPAALSTALTTVLSGIGNTPRPGTAAAAASSNPNITSSDNYVFSSSYKSVDWYGELIMQRFNPDGSTTAQQWSAMRLLDCAMTPWVAGKNYVAGDVFKQGGACYLVTANYQSGSGFSASVDGTATSVMTGTPVTRTIYTVGSSGLVPFTWSSLSTAQQAYFQSPWIGGGTGTVSPSGAIAQFCTVGTGCLTTAQQTAAQGQPLVDYLRGDRTNEVTYFRQRQHILGDIVSSEARYVKAPSQSYTDAGYSDYKTAKADRPATVFVGANDGMLHAFDALTGMERWAFVPTAVLPEMYHLVDQDYTNPLKNLHRYYVDGSPETGDICPTAPTTPCTGTTWKTILVGGLNQGGKSFYALDITDPTAPTLLWEISNTTSGFANLGYSYSNPRIIKLRTGQWVVMFASGYNNADGLGHLYVVNATTGALISDIVNNATDGSTSPATAASASNPSGLARIAARSPTYPQNNTVEEVYGGDLFGNVWRFDVNGNLGAPGLDAQLLIQLKDKATPPKPQPITGKPVVSTVANLPLIIIGTGQYLTKADLGTTGLNSMYGIKDSLTATTMDTPRLTSSKFVEQVQTTSTCPSSAPSSLCVQGQVVRTSTSNTVDWSVKNGWYVDFIVAGERSVTDAQLALGTLVFNTLKPQTTDAVTGCNGDSATISAKSYQYWLDYLTGGAVEGAKDVVGVELCDCIATRPSLVRTQDGTLEAITRMTGGDNCIQGTDMGCTKTTKPPTAPPDDAVRRLGWRELNGE